MNRYGEVALQCQQALSFLFSLHSSNLVPEVIQAGHGRVLLFDLDPEFLNTGFPERTDPQQLLGHSWYHEAIRRVKALGYEPVIVPHACKGGTSALWLAVIERRDPRRPVH